MNFLRKITGKYKPYNGVKTPLVLQLSATECGIAALAMVFGYYGVHLSLDDLRERCGTSRDGAKAATLIAAAEAMGFAAGAYRVELAEISQLPRPVIAFWRFNHYVVINGVGAERVFIHDPALGAMTVSLKEFDKSFTGIVIDIQPTSKTLPLKATFHWQSLLRCWLSGRWRALGFVLVCILMAVAAPMLNARMTAVFIDYCVIGRNTNWLPVLSLISAALGFALLVVLRIQKIAQFRLSMKASISKTAELMQHLLKLPLLFFALRQKPEIAALMMRAEIVATTLFQSLAAALVSVLTAALTLFFLYQIDTMLTEILLFILLFLFFPAKLLTRLNAVYEQANVTVLGKYYSCSLSSFKNIETIKTCGLEPTILTKCTTALHEKINAQDKSNYVLLLLQACSQSFNAVSMLVTLYVGSMRIQNGILSVGGLIAFYSLQLCFASQVMNILHALKDWQNTYATHLRLHDLLGHQYDRRFMQANVHAGTDHENILTSTDLSFHYNPTEPPVLSAIHLTIRQGQHVAFVGATGSGKSTLAKVLAHLYPPAAGRLLLYGQEWSTGGAAHLPTLIAYVAQEVCLFSGTIYDNLTLWQRNVPLSVIEAALHDACLTELIKQRGLHGKVEESGSNFSGGERQRLEIARALIQSPAILVLDEATAALDVSTEALLLKRLRLRPMTILFVAHRLATIQHCEQIFVLQHGRIIEQGSHSVLVAKAAHYYQLLQSESGHPCNM